MNVQALTDVSSTECSKQTNNIDNFDDYMANFGNIENQAKEFVVHELGFQNNMKLINKVFKLSEKNLDLHGFQLTKLSSAEKKQRAKVTERAQKIIARDIPQKVAISTMFAKFIPEGDFRAGQALVSSFAKDENEAKEIIDFFNTTRTEQNKDEYDKKQEKLSDWLDGHIQKMVEHIDFFSTHKNDDELLDYMEDNYKDIFAMMELQGKGILEVADRLNIPIKEETKNCFLQVSNYAVDCSTEAVNRMGVMASNVYKEIHQDDYYSISTLANALSSQGLLSTDESESLSAHTWYVEGYQRNYDAYLSKSTSTTATIKGRRLEKELEDIPNLQEEFESLKPSKMSAAEYEKKKQQYEKNLDDLRNNVPYTFGKENLRDSMAYLMERKWGNPQNIAYYFDGKQVGEEEAYKNALDGKFVQMINKTTVDGVEKESVLLSFKCNDVSMSRPDPIGRPLKVNIEKNAKEAAAEARNAGLDPAQASANLHNAIQKGYKDSLTDLYASLKEGSRWYISGKGDYGTLMESIKEAMNCPAEQRAEKLNRAKENAQKYLVSRAKEKTKRTDLSTLRESKVYSSLQTLQNVETQMQKVSELDEPKLSKQAEKVENKGMEVTNDEIKKEVQADRFAELEDGAPVFEKSDKSFNKEVIQGINPETKIKGPSEKTIEEPKIQSPQ